MKKFEAKIIRHKVMIQGSNIGTKTSKKNFKKESYEKIQVTFNCKSQRNMRENN